MKKTLLCLVMALCMLLSCAALAESETVTVEVRDSDGVTVLNEIEIAKGEKITDLGVTKEGYVLQGVYVTPALLRPFDFETAINEDTVLFVAWQSAVVDERPWMLAGSFKDYPENAWGKIWPQDEWLLKPVEDQFNTYEITLNLHEGDEFKIAVIGEGYAWSATDSLDSRNVVKSEYITGGEDAFDTGANIKVLQDGYYRLVLTTDAETISLCKITVERISDPIEVEVAYTFDLQVHASFLGWDAAQNVKLQQNGTDYIWYGEFDVAEAGEFGVKNYGSEAWFSGEDGRNIPVDAGHYMIFVKLTTDNKLAAPIVVGEPAYYVVGTCGNGGWAADATQTNEAYKMVAGEDGTYSLKVTFTDKETADWADGKVAFKVAYGVGGMVANEFWWGDNGNNVVVEPGEYTITFDPATGIVAVK